MAFRCSGLHRARGFAAGMACMLALLLRSQEQFLHVAPASTRPGPQAKQQSPALQRRSFALLGGAAACVGPPVRASPAVDVYFGQGSFWHVQHDFALLEGSLLGRSQEAVTAIAGYAGGMPRRVRQPVCYPNLEFPRRDYTKLGHAEVVQIAAVPAERLRDVAKAYFDAVVAALPAGRPDSQDEGEGYRCMLGLPGGSDSPLFKDVLAANEGRLKLAVGQGSDQDTLGTKLVWIYDSEKFPFFQGELYQQFHDDAGATYPASYHDLKGKLRQKGRLQEVDCPEVDPSDAPQDGMEDAVTFGAGGADPFGKVLGAAAPKDGPPAIPKRRR